MHLDFSVPTPLDYFAALVESDEAFALFEAAVSIAQDEYPELNVHSVLEETDILLARIKRGLPADAGSVQKLQALNQTYFQVMKFAGNVNDYYDPDNSYIHCLLRTRRGIPISLAVLWLELAQGLGLSARGVAFPGHFLVKVNLPLGLAVIDPMDGRSLSREELSERLASFRVRGPTEDDNTPPLGLYLQSAQPREIIARMLRNLKEIHRAQEDWHRMLAVLERLIVLLPTAWPEYRDRGLVHAELGNTESALADLECYLVHAEGVIDLDAIANRVDALRKQGH